MGNPKISIIVPVYNVEKYLEKCLNSLLLQTFEDFEIICIDDGSSDKSNDILKDFAQRDSRLKVLTQENKGQSLARNRGLEIAKGEYISFIDSDDWVSLTLYQQFINILKNKSVDIFLFNATEYYEKTNSSLYTKFFKSDYFKNYESSDKIYTIYDCQSPFFKNISVANKIYRRQFLIENDFTFLENKKLEDQLFHFKTFIKAKSILVFDEVLYFYRKSNENSTMHNLNKDIFDIFDIIEDLEKFIIKENLENTFKYPVFQYKYEQLSRLFYNCKLAYKPEFYKKMQEVIQTENLGEIDKNICSKLLNFKKYRLITKYNWIVFDFYNRFYHFS